jgi:hypothetical protein
VTSDDGAREAPFGTYEYFKLETESFLRYLHLERRPDLEILSLPDTGRVSGILHIPRDA